MLAVISFVSEAVGQRLSPFTPAKIVPLVRSATRYACSGSAGASAVPVWRKSDIAAPVAVGGVLFAGSADEGFVLPVIVVALSGVRGEERTRSGGVSPVVTTE